MRGQGLLPFRQAQTWYSIVPRMDGTWNLIRKRKLAFPDALICVIMYSMRECGATGKSLATSAAKSHPRFRGEGVWETESPYLTLNAGSVFEDGGTMRFHRG
jgi:hypothetical protein